MYCVRNRMTRRQKHGVFIKMLSDDQLNAFSKKSPIQQYNILIKLSSKNDSTTCKLLFRGLGNNQQYDLYQIMLPIDKNTYFNSLSNTHKLMAIYEDYFDDHPSFLDIFVDDY